MPAQQPGSLAAAASALLAQALEQICCPSNNILPLHWSWHAAHLCSSAGLDSPVHALQTLADLAGYGMACCALMLVNFVLLAWPGVRPTTELQLRRLTTLPVRSLECCAWSALMSGPACCQPTRRPLNSHVTLAAHGGDCAALQCDAATVPGACMRSQGASSRPPTRPPAASLGMSGCAMPPCRHFTGCLRRRRCTQLQSWGP